MFKKGTLVRILDRPNSLSIVLESNELTTTVFLYNEIHYIFNEELEVIDVQSK